MLRSVLFSLLLIVGIEAFGQSVSAYQTAYVNGKELFRLDKYELAMEAFKPAMFKDASNPYGSYASFYYALSAYNAGLKALARDSFFKVINDYPGWDYLDECRYWVAIIYFEQGRYYEALNLSQEIENQNLIADLDNLQAHFLFKIQDIDSLKNLKQRFPDNVIIAEAIFKRILENPLEDRDLSSLQEVSEIPEIKEKAGWMLGPEESPMKDTYRIGVMFPFRFGNMQKAGVNQRQSIVTQMYEGISLSYEKVKEEQGNIELYVYDTQGDSVKTNRLLESEEIAGLDLIVGPLTAQTSKLVNNYAYLEQINIINPVSSNPAINENNPYSFLFMPDTRSLGMAAAEYVKNDLEKKNVVVYYGDRGQDSIMAYSFVNSMKDTEYEIIRFQRISKTNISDIYNWLTEEQEVTDSLGNTILDENTDLPLKELVVAEDSISTVFVASFDEQIASEVISAVSQRGDSATVIGHGRWLDLPFADFDTFEKVGVRLLTTTWTDFKDLEYREFVDTYLKKYRRLPSSYALIGYELVRFMSHALTEHGKYFQLGLKDNVLTDIGFYPGLDYRFSNDNRYITMMYFEEEELMQEKLDLQP